MARARTGRTGDRLLRGASPGPSLPWSAARGALPRRRAPDPALTRRWPSRGPSGSSIGKGAMPCGQATAFPDRNNEP